MWQNITLGFVGAIAIVEAVWILINLRFTSHCIREGRQLLGINIHMSQVIKTLYAECTYAMARYYEESADKCRVEAMNDQLKAIAEELERFSSKKPWKLEDANAP